MFLEGLRVAPMLPTLLRDRGIGVFCFRGDICPIARLRVRIDPPKPGTLRDIGAPSGDVDAFSLEFA